MVNAQGCRARWTWALLLVAIPLLAAPRPMKPVPPPLYQTPPAVEGAIQPRLSWDQGRVITITNFQGAKPWVQIRAPGAAGRVQQLEALPELQPHSLIHSLGAFWGLHRVPKAAGAYDLALLRSVDGRRWETVGRFTEEEGPDRDAPKGKGARARFLGPPILPYVALPLGNGRVLGLHLGVVGEPDSLSASYVGMYRLTEEGTYRFMEPWPMGLDKPLLLKGGPDGGFASNACNPALHVIIGNSFPDFLWGVVTTPRYHVLLHATSGIAWVFDTEEGQLRRVAPLFPSMMEHLDDLSAIETVFLAWQPDYAGRILVASRSEAGVFGARALTAQASDELGPIPTLLEDPIQNPKAWAKYRKDFEAYLQRRDAAQVEGIRAYPEIRWWSFDPEDGSYTPVSAPEGAPERFQAVEDLQRLVLSSTPDGVVRCGPPKAEAPKDGAARPSRPTPAP